MLLKCFLNIYVYTYRPRMPLTFVGELVAADAENHNPSECWEQVTVHT